MSKRPDQFYFNHIVLNNLIYRLNVQIESAKFRGIEMKEKCRLALVILLIAGIGLANFAVGYKPTITPNTNYRSTYTPSPSYNSFASPIQLGGSGNPQAVQLTSSDIPQTNATIPMAESFSKLVQEEFKIIGDSNEPINNAQVAGLDGSGNSFQESTDSDGYITINGASGNWQFTVYAQGYFTKSLNRKFEYNTYEMLMLQKIGSQEKPNDNQFGNRIPTDDMIANQTAHETINDWLCESNENSELGSDMNSDQSTETRGRG